MEIVCRSSGIVAVEYPRQGGYGEGRVWGDDAGSFFLLHEAGLEGFWQG